MPNIPAVAAYESGAREFSNSEFFTNQDSNNLGIAFNAFKTQFTEGNPGYFDEEDLKRIDSINESLLREYRDKANINNFIPKPEEWETYYAPRPDFSVAKNADEKIKMAKDWEAASLEKAADLVPAYRKDFATHLEYITNNDIRESVFEAKKSKGGLMAWMDDKTNRAIEGGLTMVAPFIEGSDRWLAENFPEDPSTNEDFSSLLFAGAGQLVVQAGIALGTSAVAGPEAGVAAIGTIYSARALVEGYKEEMRKSGNAEKALDVGIAGIPGALLETTADSMLFGMGKSGKVYLDAFRKATTELEKRAVLKAAFPTLGKEALKNGIAEGTVGSIGADWTTGYGRYLASGDDSYIPTAEQLGKGALVEGLLGAGYSSLNSIAFDSSRTKAFAMELAEKNKAKSADIFKALAGKNYQEAVEIAARDYPADAAPAAKPAATTPSAATPNAPVAPNASGIVIPQPNASSKIISASVLGSENYNRLVQIRDTLKREAGTDAGNIETLKRVTEALDAIKAGTYQEPESYSLGIDKIGNKDGFTEKDSSVSTEENSYDVTLDNGKSIKSDSSTIFISGFEKSTVITKAIALGEVGLVLRDGKVHFVSPVNGVLKGSAGLSYSNKPSRSGQTAVSINKSLVNNNNENESIVTNFSILGKVDKHSKSKESKQKDSEAFDKLAAKEDGEVKDSIKEASIKEAKELVESIGNNTSFSDEAVNGEGGLKQVILDKIKIFNSIIGTSPDKLDDVIDAKDRLLKALAEAEGKITSSPSVKPVRGNVPLFQAKMAEQKTEDQLDRGFVMPKPILQGFPDGGFNKTRASDLKPILQGLPEIGDSVTYEGYEGTLRKDEGGKYTIEQNDGVIVEVSDVSDVSLVEREQMQKSGLGSFVPDETPVDLDAQVVNQEVAKAQLDQAFFSPTTNEEMSITDQFGNEYVPHNESLSKNFETDEDGGLEVLVRNKANPGKIITLTGPQALQAQEAFLENVTNLEKAGFKVSLDSKFTGKKKTPAEKLDDEIKQEVEVVQKAKKERKKKAAPVKNEEPVVEVKPVDISEFSDPDSFYRVVVGDESFDDIVSSGQVRTNSKTKGGTTLKEKMERRPTAFPSFSKGEVSVSYAKENPNHYVVVTKDGSMQPSTSGRHSKGKTMFPTDVNGNHLPSLDAKLVDVYRHTGDGKYELVYSKGEKVSGNTASNTAPVVEAKPPTPSNITSEPEAIFESVTDEGVVVETVVVPSEEKVVPQNEASLLKEIERTKKLIADDPQDKEGWSVTLKEQEAQLALLQATQAPDVPTAVQQIKEEIVEDKKEAIAAQKDEDVKISLSPKEDVVANEEEFADDPEFENNKKGFEDERSKTSDRSKAIQIVKKYHRLGYISDTDLFSAKQAGDATDVFDKVTFSQKPKLGIQKGQVAVVDVEVTNPKKGDENGYHIFSVGGKSYSVQYYSGFGNGGKKGWHLFNPETKETILIGNNKEEARTSLAKLVNDKSPDVGNFIVQDKSNSELLKDVVYTPPKTETVEEKIEKLNQKAKEAANKVISDKVDAHISTIEQAPRKAVWEKNKAAIVDYINDMISGVPNAIDKLAASLKAAGVKHTATIVEEADNIASSLSESAKAQIEKGRSAVVDEVDEKDTKKEEPAGEEDVLESVEEVVDELSKEEISEIAEELNVANNPISVSDALSTAYSDWLVNAKKFSNKVTAILKKITVSLKNKITAIAIAVSVLPTVLNSSSVVDTKIYNLNEVKSFGTAFREEQKKKLSVNFGGIDSVEINIPKSQVGSKMSIPANINISFDKETDFGGVSYSENVKDASDWILNSSNNEGKPYLVADKVNGLIYIFDKSGKLKKRTYAIFGKDQGDVIKDGKAVTPAGVFKATVDNNVDYDPAYGGSAVDFLDKGDSVLAIHRVWLGRPEEGRLDRIKSKDPTDNRISLGCINVTNSIYDNIIYPEFNAANGGMVYILPETKQGNKIVERQKLANARIKYSIGSEQPGATIDPKEAQDFISQNHPGVEVVNTRKTTEDGHQWQGRTDFTSGTPRIAINISNIRDLAQLKNVINEELAHIAYNDPSISTSLKKIIESTKLQEELGKIYESGEVLEESVVKRMADLVDSYTEKGAFGKLITAIKSLFKNTFGMELNDSDLSYIAYRAIVRAGKVTSGSGKTKFSYAGEKAEMSQFMRDSLETAKGMASSGKSSEEIRALTGWFQGKYDGKMRFEVPDNDIKINNEKFKELKVNDNFLIRLGIFEGGTPLGQILEGNSKLLDTYPELKNVLIYRVDQYENASFNPGKNAIILPSNSKNSLLHEIQHFIQLKEGFATGGNASAKFLVNAMPFDKFTSYFNIENMKSGAALLKSFNKLNALRLYKELDSKEKKAILDGDFGKGWDRVKGKNLTNKLKDKYGINSSVVSVYDINSNGGVDAYYENESKVFSELYKEVKAEAARKLDQAPISKNALYKSIAGEIESRDVEYRSNLTDEQRKIVVPYSSENISKEDAIVMFNNNGESASINTNTPSSLFEPDDDILSVVNGKISEEKKRTLKNLKRAIRKKLEKELIIDEPQAWNALKAVNYRYLDGDQLKTFNGLLWQFVRTRSKSKDPGIGVRTPTDTVIAQATELAKSANQGHFNALQLQHDFLEGKDFQNDYQGDIDKVSQLAKDERGMKDSDTPSDKDADSLQTWQLRMFELQEEAFENRDYLQDRLDEQFPSASNITNNPIIAKRAGIYTETVDDVMAGHKEVAKQYINSLMSDPTDKTWRELRRQYYGLQDFLADGYLNVDDFITEDMAALLKGEISEESFVKMYNAPWRSKMHEGASSFYANTRTMGTEVAELAHKLTSKFRAGILAAERLMADFIDPTLNEFMEKAVALNDGKQFDGEQLNLAGIYGRARQFKATESVTEGILKSKAAIEGSLKKDTNSIRTGRKEAALIHSKFTSDLYAGIDANTPNEEALGILEANAERLLPAGLIGYVKDVVDLFEVTKPLSRFTSEFGLGRPFDEVINYIPALAINKDGTPIKMDLVDITNTSEDMGLGHINQDTNMQQSGGSSTKIRKGFLPEGMVYAWNINHLAHNRMRLNLNDYLTLPQRRELNNIISGKGTKRNELAKLLKDDGQQERVSHIQRTVLTMWQNTVQASNYVSEGQGFMNFLSNMWASTKLASAYQLPGQIASNTIPYFIVHAGSPKRIKYLFDAMGIILKRRSGMPLDPRLEKTVDRVLSVIESRSQEQFLDKSIALDRNSNQVLEKLKSSSIWNSVKGINKLREKILFSPFKFSDYISGAPMMLANIMHHEEAAGRATGWEGLTYNDDSFIRSLDETERFIGIGAASRRGVWTNNKNGWMSITRNVISAFSSHRVNNATNFAVEYARIRDENLSGEEKLKSLRYIMGIGAQSAVFSAVKWGMIGMFYNLLSANMGEEDNEDELEKEYRKLLTGKHKPGDKKILEAEIAMREKIRNEFTRAKENNTRTDIVLIRGLQDVVANTFLIPAVSDIPLNMVIHAVYDQYEAESFKQVKGAAVADLEEKLKKAKVSKNTNLAIQLQKDLSRWNAQEAIPLVYEQRGVTPIGGLYGGVTNEAYKFMDAAAGSLIKAEAMSLQDALLGAGLIGLSQPDINRWARMYSKIEEHEAEYTEKLKEIKEKEIKKSRE